MTRVWSLEADPAPQELAFIQDGVLSHGRRLAHDGSAQPIACLVREEGRVVAGGTGRTEYGRLFVSYLWVDEPLRRQGIASRVLAELEQEAARRGCTDALIETLDASTAALYARRGYEPVAVVRGYVGRFDRQVLVKRGLGAPHGCMPARQVRELREAGDLERARQLALELVALHPADAALQYEAACVHDGLGLEAQAVPFYVTALAGELPPSSQRGAYLGLGSTLRTLGRYAQAQATLLEGLARFPDAAEMKTFLAMTLHNLGRSREAVELLLTVLADTSGDAQVAAYRRAIRFYAQDVERQWT